MPKKSIWSEPSRYGTYEGEKGSPEQWASMFTATFEQSESVQSILGMSAYTILGVSPNASDIEIKKIYRQFARQHHPDKGGNPEKFREYTNAYDTIKRLRNMETIPVSRPVTPPSPQKKKRAVSDEENEFTETVDVDIIIPQLLTSIEESEVESYLTNSEFCCQEKKDGKHLTLQILNGNLIVRNKKGIACGCCPDFEMDLRSVGHEILIDGEQIGNKFWVWDILEFDGKNLRDWSYLSRYMKLSKLNFGPTIRVLTTAVSEADKRKLYLQLKNDGKEGIVFKKMSGRFSAGKGLDQLKFKFYSECSVIVVAGREGRASIGMELINENGQREFVGYCSCNRNPPIGSIAEIKYLYAYRGGCLYQPAFKEIRDDVDVNECTTAQLKYKSEDN